MTTDWDVAADLLEAMLESAARILEGDAEVELPELPAFELTAAPLQTTRARVESLLSDMDQAMETLARRKTAVAEELDQADRLRRAGRQYLRF